MSLRIRKLEEQIGAPLVERTPRRVTLTVEGERFLPDARRLIALHDAMLRARRDGAARPTLRLGLSDHAAGDRLPALLQRLALALPETALTVSVGLSGDLAADFSAGRYDAVLLRDGAGDLAGRPLFRSALGWWAAPGFAWRREEPLPVIALAGACAVRLGTREALDQAGIPYREALLAGGVATVRAAVEARLGVACLDRHNKPVDAQEVGARLGLPSMGAARFVLAVRRKTAADRDLIDRLGDALESALAPAGGSYA